MKNKILQVYGTMMLPILAISNELKRLHEQDENKIEFEVVKDKKEKEDPWDWFFKDIVPLEVRDERLIENESCS